MKTSLSEYKNDGYKQLKAKFESKKYKLINSLFTSEIHATVQMVQINFTYVGNWISGKAKVMLSSRQK